MDLLWTDLYTSLEKAAGLGLEGSGRGRRGWRTVSLEVAAGGTREDEVEGPKFIYLFLSP
jgi:hypothetical protein